MTIDNINHRVQLSVNDFYCQDGSILFSNLRTVHNDAVSRYPNMEIVYPSFPNNEIIIVIDSTTPITLGKKTDFNNQTFKIERSSDSLGKIYLFNLTSQSSPLGFKVSNKDVDSGQFHHIDELKEGMKLLCIEDIHFWTYHTVQHNIYRKDILLLKDGEAQNSVIAPYDTNGSLPNCSYCNTDDSEKWFKNLKVERPSATLTNITKLVHVVFQNNMVFSNIEVTTDDSSSDAHEDSCICIEHCTNISFSNVTIHETYSHLGNGGYGYGFSLNNVWNSKFEYVDGYGTWGVFGNYNINHVYLKNCNLNRFDIHYYGKDVICDTCTFSAHELTGSTTTHRYNRYDGLHGVLLYKNCTFNDFYPVRIDFEFKLFTGFTLIIQGGTINIGPKAKCVVSCMQITDEDISPRPETAGVSWPNIIISGVTLNNCTQSSALCPYSLYEVPNLYSYSDDIDFVTLIQVNAITLGNNIYIKEFHTNVNSKCLINRVLDSCLTIIPGGQAPFAGSYVKRIY